MDNLVRTILDLLNPIIIPDWGGLVALIPIILLVLVVAWFLFIVRRYATAGPTRRAPARVPALAPPSIHMPGPSRAPILAAFGAAALFWGLVVGGVALLIGATVMTITLLLWGREAFRDYDRIEPTSSLPAIVHEGPPPGVHMPGPSIRPLLGALGTAALLGGLVVGGPLLVVALVFLSWTLVGWLVDATAEYRKVVEADKTGHLENIPPRRWPGTALQVFVAVFVVVAVAQTGLLGSLGASGAGPGASGASPAASGPALPPGTLSLVARDVAYQTTTLEVAAGKPFAIQFKNEDPAGVAHDVDIRSSDGTVLQDQAHTDGGQTSTYQYTALQPGTYVFICSVHPIPAMTGTLTVK